MKSNSMPLDTNSGSNTPDLRTSLNREKEALLAMFLANATHSELTAQYSRIDELYQQLMKTPHD